MGQLSGDPLNINGLLSVGQFRVHEGWPSEPGEAGCSWGWGATGVFFGMLTRSVYISSPQNQSRAGFLGCEAVVVAAKARHFHSVVVWLSTKGKTDEEWTAGLNGNVFPNYRRGSFKEPPVPPPAPANALSKISRCLWTQKQTERDRGHPEIWWSGREPGSAQMFSRDLTCVNNRHAHRVHVGEKDATASLAVPTFLVVDAIPDIRPSNRINTHFLLFFYLLVLVK